MTPIRKTEQELLRFALGYPEAHEDHPWGERVVKVGIDESDRAVVPKKLVRSLDAAPPAKRRVRKK